MAWWQLLLLGLEPQSHFFPHLWNLPWLWKWPFDLHSPVWDLKLQSQVVPPLALMAALAVYLWGCTPWLTPPTALAKAGSCDLWGCEGTWSLWQWSLASLAGSGFSLDSLSCVKLAPSPSWQSIPVVSPKPNPWRPSLSTQSLFATMGLTRASQLGSAAQHQSLWWIVSILPSKHLLLYSPQRVQSFPFPHPWEGFQVWGNFPPSWSPLWGTGACSKSFVSLFSYIFCPTSFCGD